jgi:HEAT repeat protein
VSASAGPDGPPERDARAAADIEALARALEDGDPAVRDRAARALGDRRDPAALPALIAALRAGRVGRGAVWALTQFADPRLVAPLVGALSLPDATARALAAGKLAELGDRAAVPGLVATLTDPDEHVREEAARALGRLGDRAALEPLLRALRDDRGDHVREEAAAALGALGAGDERCVEALLAARHDRHVMVRRAAAEALAALGRPPVP